MLNEQTGFVLNFVIKEVDKVREAAKASLLANLLAKDVHTNEAQEIANYFFGENPDIRKLTEDLLKDLNFFK